MPSLSWPSPSRNGHAALPKPSRAAEPLLQWLAWPWLLLSALFSLGWLRMHRVGEDYGAYNGCGDCLDGAVLGHDAWLWAAVLALSALCAPWRSRAWRALPALAGLAIVLLAAMDVAVFAILNQRLFFSDLGKFGRELKVAWSVVGPYLQGREGLLLLLAWASASTALAFLALRRTPSPRAGLHLLLLALACLGVATQAPDPGYVHPDAYRNVAEVNRSSGVDEAYTPDFAKAALAQPKAPMTCKTGPALRPSVVVVVVESLSAYHSRHFSGLMDATPALDGLARANSAIPDFHANGFTTDGGLIALLTGRLPLPAVGRYDSFDAYAGFDTVEQDAIGQLRRAGYSSQFFTTGTLDFLGKTGWLARIGVDHAEGAEHPFYTGLPRASFNAADDRSLYRRYLQWLDRERTPGPILSTLLTVDTHPPFRDPATGQTDELAAFRRADAAVAWFEQQLRTRGFFEDGILLVLGDHRSMTPAKAGERETLGAAMYSRVPAVVVGASGLPPGPLPGRYQQTDLLPSLLHLAGRPSCLGPLQGRFLGSEPRPARFVVHANGQHRDLLQVYAADRADPYLLRMKGDATGWQGPAPPDGRVVLEAVNRDRAARAPLRRDALDHFLKAAAGKAE
jgi:hypothetical protein